MSNQESEPDMKLFWGCFIALIATAFGFVVRVQVIGEWGTEFNLSKSQQGEIFGVGLWPFAISIVVFSLIIDKIGYKIAMIFGFVCHVVSFIMTYTATGYDSLYWATFIVALGNGTVEAYINPVAATMFKKDKTKWLNILHAGWPGGLVIGGILTILLGAQAAEDWRILIYLIAIPAIVYLVMLLKVKFPVNERVESGTSYKEMLAEFGAIGALIAGYLIFRQLGMVFGWSDNVVYGLTGAATVGYGLYCKSLGRPLLIFMCIIMIPLATTELGTDGAISGLMEEPMKEAGYNGLWVLIYTSAIMMVLRFWFAGPIVEKLGPLGLLATSAVLAIAGLYLLSTASGLTAIFIFATLYGFGKTFFWPTTLGVVSEQCPKGGALTLNAIAGIGMLAVGILGGPVIGKMTEDSIKVSVEEATSAETYGKISNDSTYFLGDYTAVDASKVGELPEEEKATVQESIQSGKQGSLASVAVFPVFMLICYILLIFYFRGKGGYKPVEI